MTDLRYNFILVLFHGGQLLQAIKTPFFPLRVIPIFGRASLSGEANECWKILIHILYRALTRILETVVTFHFSGGKVYSMNKGCHTCMIKVVIITNLGQRQKSA